MINRSAYYLQAPVGNRSYMRGQDSASNCPNGLNDIDGWEATWLASGTMSLAIAVLIAVRRSSVNKPKVLIPAYGCPDLVSAIRFAGAEPLYVDMKPGDTRMDSDIARSIAVSRDDIVALIGVDLFGISEDWQELKRLARDVGIFLIQDLAQSVQSREVLVDELHGDAVIFSFGRGKPVCCLTGGALLLRNDVGAQSRELITDLRNRHESFSPKLIHTKAAFYDFLLKPVVYAQLARLMGDRLGRTQYKPLQQLLFVTKNVADFLNSAVRYYWSEFSDVYYDLVAVIDSATKGLAASPVSVLGDCRDDNRNRRMLRLALLVNEPQSRDELLVALRCIGLSTTTMYGRTLPEIVADHDGTTVTASVPNALALSKALITLPSHGRLNRHDLERAHAVFVNLGIQK